MNITKWIELEMEDSGYDYNNQLWSLVKLLIETSTNLEKTNIRNRIIDRRKFKDSWNDILSHLKINLSIGTIQ
jgi:hypothetical protein